MWIPQRRESRSLKRSEFSSWGPCRRRYDRPIGLRSFTAPHSCLWRWAGPCWPSLWWSRLPLGVTAVPRAPYGEQLSGGGGLWCSKGGVSERLRASTSPLRSPTGWPSRPSARVKLPQWKGSKLQVSNTRPAGQTRPATSFDVAPDVSKRHVITFS